MAKKQKISNLKKQVQRYANKYARLRDTFDDGGAHCISCGEWKDFEELDGGHYIPTTRSATRFDEININAQCHRCNRFLHGNLRGYFRGMEKKYGRPVLDDLEAREGAYRWSRDELEELKEYYKEKVKRLEAGEPPEPLDDRSVLDKVFEKGLDKE